MKLGNIVNYSDVEIGELNNICANTTDFEQLTSEEQYVLISDLDSLFMEECTLDESRRG